MSQNHKEIVTCPVCFQIYQNPFLLSCMHTVCSKCLAYNVNNNSKLSTSSFMCPICKTKVKDATKDHSKQAVVDMYQKHTNLIIKRTQQGDEGASQSQSDETEGKLTCQACLTYTAVVKWKCTGCSKLMCSGCHNVHDTLPSCSDHFVMSLDEMIQEERMKLKASKHGTLTRQKSLTEQIENVQNFQKDVAKAKADALGKLEEYRELILKDIDAMYKRLRGEIENAETKLLDPLKHKESAMMKDKDELEGQLAFLDGIIDIKNHKTFLRQVNNNEGFEPGNQMIDNDEVFASPVFDIEVSYNRDIDLSRIVTVNIKTQAFQTQSSGVADVEKFEEQKQTPDYSVLVQNMHNLEKAIPLRYSPRKLVLVDNELWCVGPSAIYVHDKSGNIVRTITHEKLQQIKSLTVTNTGHVIVASWDGKGLLQIHKDGTFGAHLHDGSFSDVTSNKLEVYALSYEDGKVLIFCFQDRNFCFQKSISVAYNNGNNWDSLYYSRDSLYVCSWGNHRIYQFSLDGKLLHQFGGYSHLGAIQFKNPRICDIDQRGNILIADVGNDRLQVSHFFLINP